MSNDKKVFPKGIICFAKHEKAPDFVLGSVIINLKEFKAWVNDPDNLQYLTEYNGQKQLKMQLTNGKDGRPSLSIDTYKAEGKKAENKPKEKEDDLPF